MPSTEINKISKFLGSVVSLFSGSLAYWLIGFLVSWFLGFSSFRRFISKFQRFKDSKII